MTCGDSLAIAASGEAFLDSASTNQYSLATTDLFYLAIDACTPRCTWLTGPIHSTTVWQNVMISLCETARARLADSGQRPGGIPLLSMLTSHIYHVTFPSDDDQTEVQSVAPRVQLLLVPSLNH